MNKAFKGLAIALVLAFSWFGSVVPTQAKVPVFHTQPQLTYTTPGMKKVWGDEFTSFSKRTNCCTDTQYVNGTGVYSYILSAFGNYDSTCGEFGQQKTWWWDSYNAAVCNPDVATKPLGPVAIVATPGADDNSALRLRCEPTPGTMATQVPDRYPNNVGATEFPYICGLISTRYSVNVMPNVPWCYESRVLLPSAPGSWPAEWTQNVNVTWNHTNAAQVEIDLPEHGRHDFPDELSTNIHGSTTDGGAYGSSSSEVFPGLNVETGWHIFTACYDMRAITFKDDGRIIQRVTMNTGYIGWYGQWQNFIISMLAGDTATFPGVATLTFDMYIDWFRVYMDPSARLNVDYKLNLIGDGLGPTLFVCDPNNTAPACINPPSAWYTSGAASKANGSAVDGLPVPAVATLTAGATTADGWEYYGIAPQAGIISGQTYTLTIDFNYDASINTAAIMLNRVGSTAEWIGLANTVVSSLSGATTCSSTGTVTTVAGHKRFTCTYSIAATGDFNFRMTPNSTTTGKTLTIYAVSFKSATPR